MSVKFDLTVVAPELLDAVICMDNSPAYEAFKDEIKSILADFIKEAHFGSSLTFDENKLADDMDETMLNMHRAFLLWTYDEDKNSDEKKYSNYLKIFFKSNCDKIAALNGGSMTVEADKVAELKDKFIAEIGTDAELAKSLKEFFGGYIYGYSFNYLEEQTVMAKYAEFLVCIGIMTGKITASVSSQQKIMPKMASLLSNNRLKYINGYIPLDTMLDVVYGRFAFPKLAEDRMERIKTVISDYITAHYSIETDDEDGGKLVTSTVTTDFMTKINSGYINSGEYAENTYRKSFSGVRTFLDKDADDSGEFTAVNLHNIITKRCSDDHLDYFTTEREPNLDVSLSSGIVGYKYPLVFKDASDFWYSPVYQHIVNDLLQEQVYAPVSKDGLPIEDFPFADAVLKTNVLRELIGDPSDSYTIRADKKNVLNRLIDIHSSRSYGDEEKKMLMLEQVLYLISGSCSEEKYNSIIDKEVFSTSLFDEYISYRINKQCVSVSAKKKFINGLNN